MSKKEWKVLSKIPKTAFRATKDLNPMDSLHKFLKKSAPRSKNISEFGVSKATLEFLEDKLIADLKKEAAYLSDKRLELVVGFEMLNNSPCEVEDAEDFVLYKRSLK